MQHALLEMIIYTSCSTDHFLYYIRYVLSFPVLYKVCIIISSATWGMYYQFQYYTRNALSFLVLHHVVLEMIIHTSCSTRNDNTYVMQYWKWGMYYHFLCYKMYVLSFPVLHEVCIIISSTTWGMDFHFQYYTRYKWEYIPHVVLEMKIHTSCITGNDNTYLM
jgi:hypothetical protein